MTPRCVATVHVRLYSISPRADGMAASSSRASAPSSFSAFSAEYISVSLAKVSAAIWSGSHWNARVLLDKGGDLTTFVKQDAQVSGPGYEEDCPFGLSQSLAPASDRHGAAPEQPAVA